MAIGATALLALACSAMAQTGNQPANAKKGCADAKDSGKPAPVPAETGPQPRWACENPILKPDPIWAGKPLKATWLVKNRGEADLNLKIKGG